MCKYCEEFTLSDSDEKDGWKFFEADNANDSDDRLAKIEFSKFYSDSDEHPKYSLDVVVEMDTESYVPVTINGEDHSIIKREHDRFRAVFYDVEFCPWCGRDLMNDKKE